MNTPQEYKSDTVTFLVEGVSCSHCKVAITEEVGQVPGVESVEVDLETKRVQVRGNGLDEAAVVNAIDDAGYEAVAA